MKAIKFLLKLILFLIIVLVVWYFGSIFYHNLTTDQKPSNIVKENVSPESLGENNKIKPAVDGELLFLLAGTDQNSGDSSGPTRSDTLMLFKLNFSKGTINEISIPRDTRVPIKGKKDKINHASAYGGMPLTLKTIREWLDIDLDYYVKVNFETTIKLVDMIGGVEVNVPEVVAKGIGIKPGLQKLNGAQALEFVRFRKGYATGDFGRVKAQQNFMAEVIKQSVTSKNILRSPIFIKLFFEEVDTNIPQSIFLKNIFNLSKFKGGVSEKHIIPGEGKYIGGISYYVYDREGTIELRDKLFSDYRLKGVNFVEDY